MSTREELQLHVASEVKLIALEGDMVDDGSSTISIDDAALTKVNLLEFDEVRLDVFDDLYYHSRIFRFTNLDGSLIRGDGFFSLVASPFPLKSGNYKYKLQVLISEGNYKALAYSDFEILSI